MPRKQGPARPAARPRQRAGFARPPDRGALGRAAAAVGHEGPPDVRLAAPPRVRSRCDPDRLLRVRASCRWRFVRPAPLRGARRECARRRPGEANGMLREALSLWRGPPLAEFAYEPWAQSEIARLEELRLEALAGADRDGSRSWRERRARPRARAAGRPAPAPGGPPRPAHAGPLPLGKAGGRSRGLSRCEALARGGARHRADARAPAARALDPRPGSGARPSRRAPPDGAAPGGAEPGESIVVVRGADARAAGDPRAAGSRGGAAPDADGCRRIGEDAPGARGDRRFRGRGRRRRARRARPHHRRGTRREDDRRRARGQGTAGTLGSGGAVEYLRERQALLLLDNFEHVLDAASFLRSCWPAHPA